MNKRISIMITWTMAVVTSVSGVISTVVVVGIQYQSFDIGHGSVPLLAIFVTVPIEMLLTIVGLPLLWVVNRIWCIPGKSKKVFNMAYWSALVINTIGLTLLQPYL